MQEEPMPKSMCACDPSFRGPGPSEARDCFASMPRCGGGRKQRRPEQFVRASLLTKSELSEGNAVVAVTNTHPGGIVDVLADEANGAVTQEHVQAAGVKAHEARHRLIAGGALPAGLLNILVAGGGVNPL